MVTIKLFGLLKTLTDNRPELHLALPQGGMVRDLVSVLRQQFPRVGELIDQKKVLVSVNQEVAHPETEIRDGDEVALLPPFAGGEGVGT